MQNLKILNSKEKKNFFLLIQKQFGCMPESDYAYLKNKDNKIYIITKDFSKLNNSNLAFDSVGMYLGALTNDGFRPSIEGSQIIGKTAAKNIVEISKEKLRQWIRGKDITPDSFEAKEEQHSKLKKQLNAKTEKSKKLNKKESEKGIVIVKCKKDCAGSGKILPGKILNYIPKARIISSND